MQGTARAVFVAGALGVVLLVLCVGSGAPLVMLFDLPDAADFEGMRDERDREGRWTTSRATIEPGAVAIDDVEVKLVADRPWRPTAAAAVITMGREERTLLVGRDVAATQLTAAGPISVRVATEARREFGLRLQSLTVTPRAPGALLPSAGLAARMFVGSVLLALAAIFAGFTPFMAAVVTVLLWSLPVTLFGWANAYVTLRLVDTLWLIAPLFVFGIAALKRSLGAMGVLLGISAALLRLMLLFHPAWYFGDVEIHLKVARALRNEGRIHGWIHVDRLQQRFDLGRGNVAGAMRPLPYPVLFHTLTSMAPKGLDVPLMKSLAVGAETATILLAFLIGRRFFGSEAAGLMAGLASNLLPFETLEFLRVSFPAILGRAVDLSAMLWLISTPAEVLATARGRAKLGAWFAVCCLCYNASPVHWGLFIPLALLALVLPPARLADAGSLLGGAVVGGLLSLVFYGRYLLDVSNVLGGSGTVLFPSIGWSGLFSNLIRYHGPILIAALIAAPLCLAESWRRRESRLLLAWILWVPLAIFVAQVFREPFGYFRTQFFAYPLFAILCARWAKTPSLVSRLLLVVIVAWGLVEIGALLPGTFVSHSGRLRELD